jgi:hypothetical protein
MKEHPLWVAIKYLKKAKGGNTRLLEEQVRIQARRTAAILNPETLNKLLDEVAVYEMQKKGSQRT